MKMNDCFFNVASRPLTLFMLVTAASVSGIAQARTLETTAPLNYQPVVQAPAPDSLLGLPDFAENWDSYTAGTNVHGQGGWKGWANAPAAGALVSTAFSVSPANSIEIATTSDLVHEFTYSSGIWTITAQQYIPVGFTGRSYFIFQNVYNDAQVGLSWSTQVAMDSATGNIENEADAANPGSLPYLTGQWVPITLIVDLDADTQEFYYNGSLLYAGSWSNQFPLQTTAGITSIGAIDLFGNTGTPVYYDDIAITAGLPLADDIFADGFDLIPK